MTASKQSKCIADMKLIEIAEAVDVDRVTLHNWSNSKPKLFKAVIAGCAVLKLTDKLNGEKL